MKEEETIRRNARLVIEKFRSMSELGDRFGYDRASVECVERFIEGERIRKDIRANELAKLVGTIASYLGECVIHKYGGRWQKGDRNLGVFFDDANGVFPFNKVRKQFEHGLEGGHSIVSFFDLVGLVVLPGMAKGNKSENH